MRVLRILHSNREMIKFLPLVIWGTVLVEQNALAGVTCQTFERHRGSSNYNDYGIGCHLLHKNDAWRNSIKGQESLVISLWKDVRVRGPSLPLYKRTIEIWGIGPSLISRVPICGWLTSHLNSMWQHSAPTTILNSEDAMLVGLTKQGQVRCVFLKWGKFNKDSRDSHSCEIWGTLWSVNMQQDILKHRVPTFVHLERSPIPVRTSQDSRGLSNSSHSSPPHTLDDREGCQFQGIPI